MNCAPAPSLGVRNSPAMLGPSTRLRALGAREKKIHGASARRVELHRPEYAEEKGLSMESLTQDMWRVAIGGSSFLKNFGEGGVGLGRPHEELLIG